MTFRAYHFLLFLVLASSCNDDFLDGVDRNQLFANPTADEIATVRNDWNARDLSPAGYSVEREVTVTQKGAVFKIVSFKVNGFKEYGALLIPKSDIPMPVRMFFGGFGIDVTTNSLKIDFVDTSFDKPFILAIPAMRGQSLSITLNGVEYTTPVSGGEHCQAFDGATDDGIAFLNIIAATEVNADANRVSTRGGSRGGAVALLMAARDKRVKIAVDVAGPTDMLELTSTSENDRTYQCQFLDGLVNNTASVDDVRRTLIASSPIFFAIDLPRVQIHLAEDDKIVPVSQGEKLRTKMAELGRTSSFEMFAYPGREHSNIATDNSELNSRIEQLLSQL